jgi:hypothetical protein
MPPARRFPFTLGSQCHGSRMAGSASRFGTLRGCAGRALLRVCDGVHPPFPGHALQFLDAVIVEGDSGTGD